MKSGTLLRTLGPGILVAATGVGAGDLATASFGGNLLGLAILWAVLLGAFLKFVLNEGLTRWQLATGSTLLEGCVERLGRPVRWFFLVYLVGWSFLVAAALMSGVGVTCHAMLPILGTDSEAAASDKIIYGAVHSLLAVVLVQLGGYRLFEKVMGVCIGIMFVVVVVTAVALRPPIGEVISGLTVPIIPSGGVPWTVALLGGVGGTVTVLCYGYWIREDGREGVEDLRTCRYDLAAGYLATAIFGVAMVIIGASMSDLSGGGAMLVVQLADQLESTFGRAGPFARWAFLLGAWGAVFSSLLGVWQSVPYLFADLWRMMRGQRTHAKVDTSSLPYRAYLYAIAVVPVIGMVLVNFRTMQQVYAVVGALFMPMLAIVLLVLNGRTAWVGQYKNSWSTALILICTMLFFAFAGAIDLSDRFLPSPPP